MPMRSQAQRRYLWAREPEVAALFELETKPGAKLPEYVGDTVAKKTKKKARKKARAKKPKGLFAKAKAKLTSYKKARAKKAKAAKVRAAKVRAKKVAHAREATKLERQALSLLKKALTHKRRAQAAK